MLEQRPLVLIVEDNDDTRELYTESLRFAGFDVVTAATVEDGYRFATSVRPAVVVMDLRLPDASGAELCDRFKNDVRTSDIPTLVVTASAHRGNLESALARGCSVVRLKPYLPEALEQDLRALLAGHRIPRLPPEYEGRDGV